MRIFITLSVVFLICAIADAQIFVKQDATGANDGTSWINAFTDLQDALDDSSPGEQIWIATGTYTPDGPTPDSSHFIMVTLAEIYGGFAGTESSLVERDWQNNQTILSGDVNHDDVGGDFFTNRIDNAHHILILDVGSGESVVDGLTFIGGTTRLDSYAPVASDLNGYDRWSGGALYIRNTSAKVRNCTFQDNNGFNGSGLFARDDSSISNSLEIENSTFELNSVLNSGACWVSAWNNCFISRSVFQSNQAGNFGAGLVLGNMNAIIEDCSFDENFASNLAGACFIIHTSESKISHPSFQFNRCHFSGNNSASTGGALQLNNRVLSFNLGFDSCTFTQNLTLGSNSVGGAFGVRDYVDTDTNERSSLVRIDRTTFTENSSNYGGAVAVLASDDSLNIDITHSGFFRNTCPNTGKGGGLYLDITDNGIINARIKHTVFDGNTVPWGGGGIFLDTYYNNYRMSYVIDSCVFSNNIAQQYGGAITSNVYQGPGPIGSILNSKFLKNQSPGASGAIDSYAERLLIENCLFSENYTQGTLDPDYNGGGAITFGLPEDVTVRNSIFEKNISDGEGAAVFLYGKGNSRFENVLFNENLGNNTIFNNKGNLYLLNSTMVDNEFGLFLKDSSTTEIQNSIFDNNFENLLTEGSPEIISKGGNISSDGTMSAELTGYSDYDDLNDTDPILGPDYVPLIGSPCIDAGNPEGVMSLYDLAGNPRIQGVGIDIGSYESFTVATKDAIWDAPGFTVFPNPVKEELNFEIETNWIGDVRLVVYNYEGQQVHEATMFKSTSKQTFHEKMINLSPGEYALLAIVGNVTYATKIIIQR